MVEDDVPSSHSRANALAVSRWHELQRYSSTSARISDGVQVGVDCGARCRREEAEMDVGVDMGSEGVRKPRREGGVSALVGRRERFEGV
jgi:hypothetical protein